MKRLARKASGLFSIDRATQYRGLEPDLEISGRLELGADVILGLGPIRTHVAVSHGATCEIGDRVFVGYGSSISCERSVRIGHDTRLGPFTVIYDSDFHSAGNHDLRADESDAPPPKTGPVEIGDRVRIGEGVIILRGTTVGADAVVDAGSVLWGTIKPGEHVSGGSKRTAS